MRGVLSPSAPPFGRRSSGPAWSRDASSGRVAARGQALVEFAAVLLPILLLIVGVVQFGLLFGANVTLTNAARESARAATIYIYDNQHNKAWNDAERCGEAVAAAQQSLGFLSTSSPHFSVTVTGTGACPTPSGDGQMNGDLAITYCDHVTTPDGELPGRHRS